MLNTTLDFLAKVKKAERKPYEDKKISLADQAYKTAEFLTKLCRNFNFDILVL